MIFISICENPGKNCSLEAVFFLLRRTIFSCSYLHPVLESEADVFPAVQRGVLHKAVPAVYAECRERIVHPLQPRNESSYLLPLCLPLCDGLADFRKLPPHPVEPRCQLVILFLVLRLVKGDASVFLHHVHLLQQPQVLHPQPRNAEKCVFYRVVILSHAVLFYKDDIGRLQKKGFNGILIKVGRAAFLSAVKLVVALPNSLLVLAVGMTHLGGVPLPQSAHFIRPENTSMLEDHVSLPDNTSTMFL